MSARGLETKVGLVVVIAAVILVVGVMWFQKFTFTEERYSFHVRFDEVGGLVTGDPININGVESGRVAGVDLQPGRVVAEMSVKKNVIVPVDSRIRLKSIGIMGERFVAITTGTAARNAAAGDTLDGEFLMGMSEVMGSAGGVIAEFEQTSRNLREIVEMLSAEGRLRETMDNLAEVTERLDRIVAENEPRVGSAIGSFERVAGRMDTLVDKHYAAMDSSFGKFGAAGARLDSVLTDLATVSRDLEDVTRALRERDGTMGRLIYEDELIERLNSAVGNLDSLIADIKRHPGRYITFKLF